MNLTHHHTPQHTVIDHNRLLCKDKIGVLYASKNRNTDKLLPIEVMEGGAFLVDLQSPNTLTNVKSMAKIIAPQHEVGLRNPFLRLGDNSPQSLAVFLCPSFLAQSNFGLCKSIMVVLFEQPLRLVSPSRDIANSLNTAAQCFATLRDGFTHFRLGITA